MRSATRSTIATAASSDRERFANWFAVEYGYRASRGRR